MIALTDEQKTAMKVFNRRYIDWMLTVQSDFHVAEHLRTVSTVIQMNDLFMKQLAKSLGMTLDLQASHAGLKRGLLGHCMAFDRTMAKLEDYATSWNDQFGENDAPTAKFMKKKKNVRRSVQTEDDGESEDGTEILIKIRKSKH